MRPEFIVAVKEFKDYLSSKRFLLIFAVLAAMCIAAIISGVSSYNSQLATYNEMLQRVGSNTSGMRNYQPEMPSMMLIFHSFYTTFAMVGWLLAIAIGFDLISKEKETGSLKLLLARPTYRDSIINGKIIGSASVLIVSLAAMFLIALALLLFEGIVPAGDDLIRLLTFFIMIVLFCIAFLGIGIAASALSKNSTMAILLAIGVVVFSLLLPSFASTVCDVVLGDAPTMTIPSTSTSTGTSSDQASGPQGGGAIYINNGGRGISMQINPEYTAYMQKRNQITEVIDLLSPTSDLTAISSVVVDRQSSPSSASAVGTFDMVKFGGSTSTSLGNSISSVLAQIIALLVMAIGGFAIAYAKFIRMDVR